MPKHLLITGKVQGVWFRESTREAAERFQASGWIRNLPDGRVEVLIGGEPDAVERLVEWCHHGPSRADVEEVVVTDSDDEVPRGFQVLR